MSRTACFLLLFLHSCSTAAQQSIDSFGAIPGINLHSIALTNGLALAKAIAAANSSTSVGLDRTVLVPANVYSFLPSTPSFNDLVDITIKIEGTLNISVENFTSTTDGYPGMSSGNPYPPLSFNNPTRLSIVSETGNGLINGRGNNWWWATIILGLPRPNLLNINGGYNVSLSGMNFLNGPQFHVCLSGVTNVNVNGVTVLVDIEDQLNVYRYIGGSDKTIDMKSVLHNAGMIGPPFSSTSLTSDITDNTLKQARINALPESLSLESWFNKEWRITPPVPMIWALNTDGIDISGTNVHVWNCSITNFDDTVCPKPMTGCSTNYLIEDIRVTYGVGVSMGSVPPDPGNNCISGVLARRLHFESPLKAIYIKPNPAKSNPAATGEISNITYEDVEIQNPIWWSIWVGTQQQQQPGSAGTGCSFLYPLDNTTCPTDPQVSVFNITLRRINVYNSNSPGVLLMNVSNPGRNFVWEDVIYNNISGWPIGNDYLCENIEGVALGKTNPIPPCFSKGST
jgi:hypothetical protein